MTDRPTMPSATTEAEGAPEPATAEAGSAREPTTTEADRAPEPATVEADRAPEPATAERAATGATGSAPSSTAQAPGERRLAHPPSDRYRAAEAAAAAPDAVDPAASVARGVAYAAVAAIAGAAVTVVLGGIVTLTAGLVGVAIATGWAVAAGLRFGADGHLVGGRRLGLAVGIALGAVALGQLGLWLYALTEGGVLPLPEYLLEVFGILVPAQAVAAGLAAWLTAR